MTNTEDVEEITRKVEEIKIDIGIKFEDYKWKLNQQATLHRLFIERELQAIAEISPALFEMHIATISLRPTMDHVDSRESEEDRHKRRYNEWAKGRDAFMVTIEKNKIFLPQYLYTQFTIILRIADEESFSFKAYLQYGEGKLSPDAYERGREITAELNQEIDKAISLIRQRFGIEDNYS